MKSFLTNLVHHKKLIFGLVAIVVIITGAYLFFNRGNGAQLILQEVKRANIKSTTSASGVLTGKTTVNLKFKTSGKLAYINVKTGSQVTKGQALAGLDTQDLAITLQQAQNSLREAQAKVDKVHDDLKDNDDKETYTQRQTRTSAEVTKDNAYDEVKAAQKAFQDAIIYAPINGVVTKVGAEPGQNVSATDIITQIVDHSEIFFDADLDEADLGRISLGQSAIVTLDASTGQELAGTITQILPATKLNSSNATVVPIRISIPTISFPFVNGLSGQTTIILQDIKNALVIPQEALLTDDTILLKTAKGVKKQKIQTGINSDTEVEVISGVAEGDWVVTNPSVYKP